MAVRLAFSSSSSVRSSMMPVYSGAGSTAEEGWGASGSPLESVAECAGRGLGVARGVGVPFEVEGVMLIRFERVRLGGAGRAIIGDSVGGETPPMVTRTPAVGLTGEVAAMSFVGVWLRIC